MKGPIKKTIHTELYSDKAYSIILGFYYGLNDWGSKQMARNSGYCYVERAPDNEVVLTIKSSDSYTYSWNKTAFVKHQTDQDTRNWMAWIIKQLVRKHIHEVGDDESVEWNRSNDRIAYAFSSKVASVTVSDCYFVYDFLKNRKNLDNKFTSEHIAEIIGNKRDAISTELEITRREEEKKIRDKYNAIINGLNNSRYSRGEAARKKVYEEIDKQVKAEEEAMRAELKALNEMLNITT